MSPSSPMPNVSFRSHFNFQYREAHYNFANYDLLIGAINNYQQWGMLDVPAMFGPRYDRVNIFYSHPEYYTRCKYRETLAARNSRENDSENFDHSSAAASPPVPWKVKTDDFFPYSDGPHSFWTGYFTSRAAFKRFERVASSFLLAARQIEAIAPTSTVSHTSPFDCGYGRDNNRTVLDPACTCCRPLNPLEDALGVVQHHDAVSGTAKQHVADDYSRRLQDGLDAAAEYVISKLRRSMLENPDQDLQDLAYCQLLNETICRSEVRSIPCGFLGSPPF